MRGWMLGIFVLVVACSDAEDKTNNSAPGDNNLAENNSTDAEVGRDVDLDVQRSDAGEDADDFGGPLPNCADDVTEGFALTVDAQGPSGQFYVTAGFDGNSVWLAYNRPESEAVSDEGIYVVRLACDGTVLMPPTLISPPSANARNYSPTLVASRDFIYAVWVHHPNGGNAKKLLLKTFRPDGSAFVDEAVDITPSLGGMAISETIWQPDVAATPDGLVLVAEVLGSETQVVVERVTPDGLVTETFLAYGEKGVDQKGPSVGTDEDGIVWVSWIRSRPADPENNLPEQPATPVYVSFEASQTPREGAPVMFPAADELTSLTAMNASGAVDGMYLGYTLTAQRSSVLVRKLSGQNLVVDVGSAGHANFRPSLVHAPGGGAVAWYRYTTSPLKNSVVLQPFEDLGTRLQAGPEVVVLPEYEAIQPYGPALTYLGDDFYFVAYSQGASAPEARVVGKFVRAPRQ